MLCFRRNHSIQVQQKLNLLNCFPEKHKGNSRKTKIIWYVYLGLCALIRLSKTMITGDWEDSYGRNKFCLFVLFIELDWHIMASDARYSRKKRRKTPSVENQWMANIRCRHCGLKYRANPNEARCPKCNCAANKPLPFEQKLIGLVLPPLALIIGLTFLSHSPRAAFHSFVAGGIGAAVWVCFLLIFMQFR